MASFVCLYIVLNYIKKTEKIKKMYLRRLQQNKKCIWYIFIEMNAIIRQLYTIFHKMLFILFEMKALAEYSDVCIYYQNSLTR